MLLQLPTSWVQTEYNDTCESPGSNCCFTCSSCAGGGELCKVEAEAEGPLNFRRAHLCDLVDVLHAELAHGLIPWLVCALLNARRLEKQVG